jgi:antitoxin component of RelBE/YafQ-DinJ toxin-antitoxin module
MKKVTISLKADAAVKSKIMKQAEKLGVSVSELLESKIICLLENNWEIIGNETRLAVLEKKLKNIKSIISELSEETLQIIQEIDSQSVDTICNLIDEVYDTNNHPVDLHNELKPTKIS